VENNFFCKKPVINVLLEPKKSSKVSSQLIYGEKFQIISRSKNYIKVNPKLLRDGDPVEIFSNPQKLKNDYGWEAKYNLESFIKKIINWKYFIVNIFKI